MKLKKFLNKWVVVTIKDHYFGKNKLSIQKAAGKLTQIHRDHIILLSWEDTEGDGNHEYIALIKAAIDNVKEMRE